LELNATYFHHEIVRRAFLLAIDCSAAELESFARLVQRLHRDTASLGSAVDPSSAVPAPSATSQIASGFRRLHAEMDDIRLDAPQAPRAFAECVARAIADGVLTADFAELIKETTVTPKAQEVVVADADEEQKSA
jgi:hypothetical protein